MTLLRIIAAAALAAVASGAVAEDAHDHPSPACPLEHRLSAPRTLEPPPDQGAVREVLTYIDISGWRGVEGLALRIRRITVVPGGWVPLHWHNDRPAVDYLVEGELVEHNAFCAVPIRHKAGDSGRSFGPGYSHWWVNDTGADAVIISSDVVPIDKVNF